MRFKSSVSGAALRGRWALALTGFLAAGLALAVFFALAFAGAFLAAFFAGAFFAVFLPAFATGFLAAFFFFAGLRGSSSG
jgi:hypothetical protein